MFSDLKERVCEERQRKRDDDDERGIKFGEVDGDNRERMEMRELPG